MTVKELIDKLQKLPNKDVDVFYRIPHLTGNIMEVDGVHKDTYSFFGKNIPCVIIDNQRQKQKPK